MARPPQGIVLRGGTFNKLDVPPVTPGLPAEVLARRPDVLNAEASLAAANANIVVARAQLLPSVTLTGSGGWTSLALETLTRPESLIFNLAAGLTQPIFRGGALRGQVQLNEAQAEELLATYRFAILNALVDTENSLVALRQTTEQERAAGQCGPHGGARLCYQRGAAAGRHHRHRHPADHPADAVLGAYHPGPGPAGPAAGGGRAVPGARWRLGHPDSVTRFVTRTAYGNAAAARI